MAKTRDQLVADLVRRHGRQVARFCAWAEGELFTRCYLTALDEGLTPREAHDCAVAATSATVKALASGIQSADMIRRMANRN